MRGWVRTAIVFGVGLLAGLGVGLYLGWVAMPTEFTDADPALLDEGYRRDYTVMIATAYSLDGDLAAARQRLAGLREADANGWLLSLTVDSILSGSAESDIRHLVRLAHDLGLESPVMEPYRTPGGSQP